MDFGNYGIPYLSNHKSKLDPEISFGERKKKEKENL